jgi:hypothetical protein
MCAFTASRSEKMESLSAGGPGWQVRVPDRRDGQKMDKWGWAANKSI